MMVGAEREKELRARFRARGLTLTRARRAVLAAVGEGGHPTAAEVHLAARTEHPRLSLGAAYAALSALETVGLVAVRRWPNSPARYDTNLDPAVLPVRCVRCGAIEEVRTGAAKPGATVEMRVRKASTYEDIAVSVLAEGVCRACSGEAGGKGEA